MPLQKLVFKPGIDRETSRYAGEGGWYEGDKVRFRQGYPERIGGWRRISSDFFQGVCRSLNTWVSNGGASYVGVGTNLKFYVENGGVYYDATPLRGTTAAGDVTFSATNGSNILAVADVAHGCSLGDFVTFSDAVSLGGVITDVILNAEYQVLEVLGADSYTVQLPIAANASDTGNGGTAVVGEYQISIGPEIVQAISGWGAGPWGGGPWGVGEVSNQRLRIWTQTNFGEDLVFGPSGGGIYYWDSTGGNTNNRGVLVSSFVGASDVPIVQNYIISSDIFRFVFCLGTNNIGDTVEDKLLVRWSDQEDVTNWTPQATNQAGSIRLSRGSEIVTAIQARQELLIWTDAALYSFQYVGAPAVWGAQAVGSNTSIASKNARAFANGVAYWMGKDGFYIYDGRVQTLPCSLRRYIFDDINREQYEQVFAGTLEAFNEVWFYYPSANSTKVDRYVLYNYVENTWSYGTLGRTAWVDSGLEDYPLAATYSSNVVSHEFGLDDNETDTEKPIRAFIRSTEFDIEDGDRVMFVWRCLPDINFAGSTAANPQVTMSFDPLYNSGSGYNLPRSVGGNSTGAVTRSASLPVQQFTEQLDLRIRGRQLSIEIESEQLGVQWQLGAPRLQMRADGRR